MRFLVVRVFTGLVVVTACSPRLFQRGPSCLPAPADAVAFDSTRVPALAGDYDLVLVSQWEREAGRSVRGRLHLEATDSVHRSFEMTVYVPWTADPASHDPEHPGVLLHSNGQLELGVWRGLDGSSTNLGVELLTPHGFAGRGVLTWASCRSSRMVECSPMRTGTSVHSGAEAPARATGILS